MRFRSFLLVFPIINGCLSEDSPFVKTKSGKIRGHYLTSYKGNRYEAYQGIPFALPPTEKRRFRSPVPVKAWSHTLKATKLSQPCPQEKDDKLIGSEDCLYLNVYVPERKNSSTIFPVIFFIHGGAYRIGFTPESSEHFIMDYDVIYVSTQYRLSLLGFLSTEDEVVPGNMGLKDQSTALRWTHDNIKHFGGDPKKITLIGWSAGAGSVHYHYLSPWSRGLFHAGISISGNTFAPWAVNELAREKAVELGQVLNCTDECVRLMIECLKTRSVDQLISARSLLKIAQNQPLVPFAPVIEKPSANAFIHESPIRIIARGDAYDVRWITGIVQEEGLVVTAFEANDAALIETDAKWFETIPKTLDYYYTIPKEQRDNVSLLIREHYFKGSPVNMATFHLLTDIVTDRMFKVSAENAAMRQASANKSPVFYYHYSYRATDSNTVLATNSPENLGVCHGDDVDLILVNPIVSPLKSPKDMAMHRHLIQLWTSVAYHGVPDVGVEWRSVSPKSDTFDYLQIDDPSNFAMKSSDNFGQKKFWNSIPFNENRL